MTSAVHTFGDRRAADGIRDGARVAVLLPCYNESLSIGKVVQDSRQALPQAEIWVHDNNSTDGSAELARARRPERAHGHPPGKVVTS